MKQCGDATHNVANLAQRLAGNDVVISILDMMRLQALLGAKSMFYIFFQNSERLTIPR